MLDIKNIMRGTCTKFGEEQCDKYIEPNTCQYCSCALTLHVKVVLMEIDMKDDHLTSPSFRQSANSSGATIRDMLTRDLPTLPVALSGSLPHQQQSTAVYVNNY